MAILADISIARVVDYRLVDLVLFMVAVFGFYDMSYGICQVAD